MVCFHSEKMQVIDAKLLCERERDLLYLFNVQPETEGLPPRKYATPVLRRQPNMPPGTQVVFEYDNNSEIIGVFATKDREQELQYLRSALDNRNFSQLEAICFCRTYDEIMHLAHLLGYDRDTVEERLQEIT